mmetsp:Transcript_17383/g.34095  ORF Transcript_17383/g.34095 Transcript_17383/m.34095 type:complete len:98 (+) Transcript_17383:252-545(+)
MSSIMTHHDGDGGQEAEEDEEDYDDDGDEEEIAMKTMNGSILSIPVIAASSSCLELFLPHELYPLVLIMFEAVSALSSHTSHRSFRDTDSEAEAFGA